MLVNEVRVSLDKLNAKTLKIQTKISFKNSKNKKRCQFYQQFKPVQSKNWCQSE